MGSKDGTVQIWEAETGRCLQVWEVDETVKHVSWNLEPDLPILAVCVGQDLLLLNTGIGKAEEQSRMRELLNVEESPPVDDSGLNTSIVRWSQHDKHEALGDTGRSMGHLAGAQRCSVQGVFPKLNGIAKETILPQLCLVDVEMENLNITLSQMEVSYKQQKVWELQLSYFKTGHGKYWE
ncbi:hypothetical protein QJS10_CPA08g00501 [Acorus calamus]|uniref:Uncharacterized protein n=1 Tax=Acorus calamus TaxID=4465 RepID=A0AAV9EEF6_ACOCL|nr:hypothetical protein QJS10_CPA08g00501 [Acorus calamus]